jgi:hypothetical protein
MVPNNQSKLGYGIAAGLLVGLAIGGIAALFALRAGFFGS